MKKHIQRARNRDGTGQRKRGLALALLPALIAGIFSARLAFANPGGAQVVNGQVAISSNGNVLAVTNSPGAIINWQTFSINPGELTRFLQQSAASTVLNRVIGQNPSTILGTLQSNGKVFLINPNGILFGQNAQVDVGALFASTLRLSDQDFLAGRLNFSGTGTAAPVINQGRITTPSGGQVYLIAPRVENTGIITTPQGEVLLAAGHSVQLLDTADPNITLVISAADDKAVNLGQVVAAGGKVGIFGALVTQSGVLSADSAVTGQHGEILLRASQDVTLDGGSRTSATGGGSVSVQGNRVVLTDQAQIDVSGPNGGGKVSIGGGFHGVDPAIRNADTTYVGPQASIRADALQGGDGGQVAVWSDGGTFFYGKISARGGAEGGNGGFVETSGKNRLDYRGNVDLRAPHGKTGSLLLDPYTVTIDDTGSAPVSPTGSNPISYTAGSDSDITAATLNSQLASANVIVQAGPAGGGSIVVASNNLNWNSASTLTLKASADVNINGSILGQSGTLELIATSGTISQTAPVNVASLIARAGGDVALTNAGNIVGTLAGTSGGSNGFSFTTNDNVTAGSISGNLGVSSGIGATGTGGVHLVADGSVSTSGGLISGPSLTIQAGSGVGSIFNPLATSVGTLTVTNGGSIGGGDIVVANSGGQALTLASINQTSSPSLGRIYISGDNSLTVGSGGITQNNGNPGAEIGLVAAAGIQLNGPIHNGAYSVGLKTTAGNMVEGSGGFIEAGALSLAAPGGFIALDSGSNAIGVAAGSAGGNLTINNNVGTMVIGSVSLANNSFIASQSGITSTSGSIGLQNSGSIYLANPVSATAGSLGLVSSGGYVHQASSGTLTAQSGSVTAYGDVNLTANNSVATLAGQSGAGLIGGNFLFTNSGNLSVGAVAGIGTLVAAQNGITAQNGYAVGLSSANGSIATATGSSIAAAGLTLNAYQGIGSSATPLSTATGIIQASNGAGGNDIVISNSGQPLSITGSTQSTSGNIFISNGMSSGAATLTVNGAVSTPAGQVALAAGGNLQIDSAVSASGALGLFSAAGNIAQSLSTSAGGAAVSAASLSASATLGSVTLENPNNSAATVAGSSASGWSLVNGSMEVGSVAAVGPVAAASGLATNAGTLTLQSSGAINDSAGVSLTAPTLNLGASAAPLLINAGILGASGTDLYLRNGGTATLNVLQALGSGNVAISTAGDLSIGTGTNSANFTGSTLLMVAAGALNIGAGNVLNFSGPVNLYAGYTQAVGAAPVSNNSAATMTLGASQVNGASIDLWSNAYTDFQTANASFSTTPVYHPAEAAGNPGPATQPPGPVVSPPAQTVAPPAPAVVAPAPAVTPAPPALTLPGPGPLTLAQRPVFAAGDYSQVSLLSGLCLTQGFCWTGWQTPIWIVNFSQFKPLISFPANGSVF